MHLELYIRLLPCYSSGNEIHDDHRIRHLSQFILADMSHLDDGILQTSPAPILFPGPLGTPGSVGYGFARYGGAIGVIMLMNRILAEKGRFWGVTS